MIGALRQHRRRSETAAQLCNAAAARARDPVFYRTLAVADSMDGRFDLLVLHAWLILGRLQELGEHTLAQSFVDALFTRFDEALREQGASDIGIGRRIKKMADAFYGRLRAYSESGDANGLASAILRNVYRGENDRVEQATLLAKYVDNARRQMISSRLDRGEVEFAPISGL